MRGDRIGPSAQQVDDRDEGVAAEDPQNGLLFGGKGRWPLVTAKTQRWKPQEFLRTLVEAEIAARDAFNARTRLRQAAFPVTKTLEEFDVAASSIPPATFDYLASLEWIRASENVCLIGPAEPARATCSSPWASPRSRPATGSGTPPPPNSSGLSTEACRQLRRQGHRDPAAQRPRARRRAWSSTSLGSHPWTTPAPNCCSVSSRPPTSADRSGSAVTGPSSPGVGSCPSTPPQSSRSTGSCTTATPWSPTATPTE